MLDEVLVTWALSFGRWYGFSSFRLADSLSEHFCASDAASKSALTHRKFSHLTGMIANLTGFVPTSLRTIVHIP